MYCIAEYAVMIHSWNTLDFSGERWGVPVICNENKKIMK
jgi:hypothetical protein